MQRAVYSLEKRFESVWLLLACFQAMFERLFESSRAFLQGASVAHQSPIPRCNDELSVHKGLK